MRYILTLCMTMLITTAQAHAADIKLQRAMDQFKRNHYNYASELRLDLLSMDSTDLSSAYLILGMSYLKSANLYNRLHGVSISANLEYLGRISDRKGKNKSQMAMMFLAEAYLAAKRPAQAAFYFQKVLKDPDMSSSAKDLSRVGLGLSLFLQGNRSQAQKLWDGLAGSNDPEVLSELASAFVKAGLKDKNPLQLCERALMLSGKSGERASSRVVSNSISVYASEGQIEKGLNLVRGADLKGSTFQEELGRNKTLLFYNLSQLENLAVLYGRASIHYLEKAVRRPKPNRMVFYYLAEAYSISGMPLKSNKAVDSFLTSWPLPKLQKSAATAIRAQNSVTSGKISEGKITFDVLARENWQNPRILAQALNACSNVLDDCSGIVSSVEKMLQSRKDRSYSELNYALGRHYLAGKKLDSALSYMEAGRDKSYKNKIEYNDPLLLVDLADVYFKSKKFSEALEILFEMSLQYPAVRQIQNAMQGVYSMVQESAGDVKVL